MFKLCVHVAFSYPGTPGYMAFAIKGQTKAAVAFKGKFGIHEPILFKLCVEVAYCSPGTPGYMAFAIKGKTKAAASLNKIVP